MTILEFIKELQKYPLNMDVVVPTFKGFYVGPQLKTKFMGSHQKDSLVIYPKLFPNEIENQNKTT